MGWIKAPFPQDRNYRLVELITRFRPGGLDLDAALRIVIK